MRLHCLIISARACLLRSVSVIENHLVLPNALEECSIGALGGYEIDFRTQSLLKVMLEGEEVHAGRF